MSNNKGEATRHNGNYADINGPYDQEADVVPAPKRRKRIGLWLFLALQALFLIWIITGIAGNSAPADTGGVLTQSDADAAKAVGTGLGVALIVGFWMTVDVIIGVIVFVVHLARRK